MSTRSAETQALECPATDVLAQLVSGSLAEHRAEKLFSHIEFCGRCQKLVDKIGQRAEQRLPVTQTAGNTPNEGQGRARLNSLIEKAQKLKTDSDMVFTLTTGPSARTRSHRRVNMDGFVDGLKRSGLFAEGEVFEFLGSVNTDDSGQLAKALIERGKLTNFQARLLLRGRWKGFVLGNYVILDKLGEGGMGSVFKARHRRMGRVVCIKVMNPAGRKSPELMKRFQLEARTVGALNHPNIVVAHDANEENGIPFLVMEYIEGKDLSQHVSKHGPLLPAKAIAVVIQAAQALSYAHGAGVIHRDVKPHNLLLSEKRDEAGSTISSVKILDMGLARFDSFMSDNPDASVAAAMTNSGIIMGTVDYMAPEQAICTRDADNRSDIYSLGCTLHYLLTGRAVYDGSTVMARLVAHREQPIPSLKAICPGGVPKGLDAVFRKMLAKQQVDRYQSMDDVAADLTEVAASRRPKIALPAVATRTSRRTTGGETDPTGSETLDDMPLPRRRANRNATAGPTRRKRRGRRGWVVWPIAILAAIGLIHFSSDGIPFSLSQTGGLFTDDAGHPAALRNGGNGRAVFLLPTAKSSYFRDDQFVAFLEALKKRGIESEVMGLTAEPVRPKKGKVKPFKPTMRFADFDPRDFDAVFVVEADLRELTSKNPEGEAQFKSVLEQALDDGQVVAAMEKVSCVIDCAGLCKDLQFSTRGGLYVGKRHDSPGRFLKVPSQNKIDWATEFVFTNLLKDRGPATRGASR